MKFAYKQGLIWTSLELFYNGNWLTIENCILDTGSASTAIDIDLIDLNYSKQTKIKRLFGIGTGTQEVISQIVESIKIDSNVIENIEIEFGNFSSKIGINGFIGNDILSKFYCANWLSFLLLKSDTLVNVSGLIYRSNSQQYVTTIKSFEFIGKKLYSGRFPNLKGWVSSRLYSVSVFTDPCGYSPLGRKEPGGETTRNVIALRLTAVQDGGFESLPSWVEALETHDYRGESLMQ